MKTTKRKQKKQEPLTAKKLMEVLVDYNEKILIPSLEEIFVSKNDFGELKNDVGELKNDFGELKDDVGELKNDFGELKDEAQKNFDKLFQKLDILLEEKIVREHQEEKEKKLWAIVLKSLKDHNILTNRELEIIAKLELF